MNKPFKIYYSDSMIQTITTEDLQGDYVVVTDDNPRSEDPALIRSMVLEGVRRESHVIECGDRAEAILRAIDMLDSGDGLLITGKGHETGQIIGDDVLPFNDVEQASVAVAALERAF